GCVARQSQRPQPRGLFTRGQTGCLVFGHRFLTLEPLLFLLLENRFGSVACVMSVQRRYSFSGESPHRTDPPGDRMPSADVGLVNKPTPFRVICSAPHPNSQAMQRVPK